MNMSRPSASEGEINGALCFVRALEAEGVDIIFGYPGGAIMPTYDALLETHIKHILTRHEQGAAIMAEGYAKSTGKVGVCLATSGPGATNLVTGIADAYLDSVPMVAITGQVAQGLMGTDAFQEVDIIGITLPIVKHSFLIRDPESIDEVVHEAFHVARSGRPGPVLIDFPKDIQLAPTRYTASPVRGERIEVPKPHPSQLGRALRLLQSAKKPVLYSGGGVKSGKAVQELRDFVKATGIPTVHTLKGLGGLPRTDDNFMGMLGMHGFKAPNLAIHNSDLLVVVGARFDDRATGKLSTFAPNAKIIHMDIDAAEVGKLRKADATLVGDARESLKALSVPLDIQPWRDECQKMKTEHAWDYNAPTEKIYAPKLLRDLSIAAPEDTFVTCDVGQHQMWVAQHFQFKHPKQHLTSGGLGTMGFGLPAAIGAQFANPDAKVICVSGDGSIMMNIQELVTIAREQLPVKIILMDNGALGMVRQWQELFFSKRYSEIDLSDNPDFCEVAKAFGIPSMRIELHNQVDSMIERVLGEDGPLLVHTLIDQEANVWPLVPPGKSNAEMMEGAAK